MGDGGADRGQGEEGWSVALNLELFPLIEAGTNVLVGDSLGPLIEYILNDHIRIRGGSGRKNNTCRGMCDGL